MILSPGVCDALPGVFLFIAFAFALVWRIYGAKTTPRKVGYAAGIVVSLFAAMNSDHVGTDIVIVRFPASGSPVEKTRGKLFGPRHYTFQNGTRQWIFGSVPKKDAMFGTWVVNDSPRALRVEYVSYATDPALGLGPTPPAPVPPMSVFGWDTSIDDVGPDETPPESMSSPMGVGVRMWLTWDEATDP